MTALSLLRPTLHDVFWRAEWSPSRPILRGPFHVQSGPVQPLRFPLRQGSDVPIIRLAHFPDPSGGHDIGLTGNVTDLSDPTHGGVTKS